MKHKIGYNRLGRRTAHRKSMTRNMLTSFFRYEKIRTTKAKALVVRRAAEKMITRARVDSVHNRRMINRDIKDQAVLAKLFTEIGPRYLERPGGYTRILKLGPRKSDAAEMVILELVAEELPKKTAAKKSKKSGDAKKAEDVAPKKKATKSEPSVEEAPVGETPVEEAVVEDGPVEETESAAEPVEDHETDTGGGEEKKEE